MDRNVINEKPVTDQDGSLSARRAWIEMQNYPYGKRNGIVALRKESVDRNISEDVSYSIIVSRSPQGERG